jgi:predicted nuclease with TOPRIM domain
MLKFNMSKLLEAIDEISPELRLPLLKAFTYLKEEIAETVKKSDFERFEKATEENFNRVWKAIEELAEAQKRTEQRVEELAEAQKRTEQRVEELAEAQKKTEEEIRELSQAIKDTRKEVGGLSHTIGYTLENQAFKALPHLLNERYNLTVEGTLTRRFIEYPDGREDEINIIGTGILNGKKINIIGEAKVQLSQKHIDSFLKTIKRLEPIIHGDKFLLMVTHSAKPSVVSYAESKSIAVFFSYEF